MLTFFSTTTTDETMTDFEHPIPDVLRADHHPKVKRLRAEEKELKRRLATVEQELAALDDAQREAAITREMAREAAESVLAGGRVEIPTRSFKEQRAELERQKEELELALDGLGDLVREAEKAAAEEISRQMAPAIRERYAALLPHLEAVAAIHGELAQLRDAYERSHLNPHFPWKRLRLPHKMPLLSGGGGTPIARIENTINLLRGRHGY